MFGSTVQALPKDDSGAAFPTLDRAGCQKHHIAERFFEVPGFPIPKEWDVCLSFLAGIASVAYRRIR